MSVRAEKLPWDSEFFGVSVGRITLEGVDLNEIPEVDKAAREEGIECL